MNNTNNHKELFKQLKTQQEDLKNDNNENKRKRTNPLILVTCVLEFIILAFVTSMELILRYTTVFPYRRQTFSCLDKELSRSTVNSEFVGLAFDDKIPDTVIFPITFCVPPFVIIIGEISVWAFTNDKQKSIKVLCQVCSVPQVIRRIIRFIGVFVFGAVCLMVFVDVIKLVTGRLRPNFLETCRINRTLCKNFNHYGDDRLCEERNEIVLRHARTSFPSMNAALSAYAATFVSTYIHGALQSRSVRILRPFLALVFIMLAMITGLVEVGVGFSHWTDVIAGFAIGVVIAIYLVSYVLQKFHEYAAERQVLILLHEFLKEHQLLVELTKEFGPLYTNQHNGEQIPRAQIDTTTRAKMYDKFQRDLSSTVEHYKDRRQTNKGIMFQL